MAGNKQSIEAGRGHVTLSTDATALERGLQMAQAKLQSFGRGVVVFGAGLAALGASITGPMLAAMTTFTTWGDEMTDAMRQTGMSFSELDGLMDGLRVSADELVLAGAGLSSFLSHAASGSREANQALERMGLTLDELSGMSQGERMEAIADAISRIGDASQRIAMQRAVFGRGGLALNLEGGAAGMQARAARMDYLEGQPTEADRQLARETGVAFREMGTAIAGLWREIGAAAAPAMRDLFRLLTDGIVMVRGFVEENRPLVAIIFRVAGAMVAAGTALIGIGSAIYGASYAFAFLAGAIGLASGAATTLLAPLGFLAGILAPIASGIAAVAAMFGWWLIPLGAAVAGVVYLVTQTNFLSNAWDVLISAFDAVTDFFVYSGLADFAQNLLAVAVGVAVVFAAITGLVGYLSYLAIDSIIDAHVQAWGVLVDLFSGDIDLGIMAWLSDAWDILAESHAELMSLMRDGFNWLFGDMIAIGRFAIGQIAGMFSGIATAFSGALTSTWENATALFSGLADTAAQTWGGIMDAFAIGDWEMMWSILQATAQLAWAQITAFVEPTVNAWADAFEDAFNGVWGTLRNIFEAGWAYLRQGFYSAALTIVRTWNSAYTQIASAMDALNPMLNDEQRARRDVDRVNAAGQQELALQRSLTQARAEFAAASTRDAFQVDPAVIAARAARDAALQAGNQAEIARRQAELDALTAEADFNRQIAAVADVAVPSGPEGLTFGDRGMTLGTFSAAAAFGLLGGAGGESQQQRAERQRQEGLMLAREQLAELRRIQGGRFV